MLADNSKGVEGETHPSLHASVKLAAGEVGTLSASMAVVGGDGVQQEAAVMPKDTRVAGNWKLGMCWADVVDSGSDGSNSKAC